MARGKSQFFPDTPTIFDLVKLTPEQEWWFDFRSTLDALGLTVARYLLDGLSSTEIAEVELNSAKTIRQHVSRIYAKFGVSNRADFFRLVYSYAGSAPAS